MKQFLAVVSSVALAACGGIAGAAQQTNDEVAAKGVVQRDYQVGRFDRVASMGPHLVLVTIGGRHSLRAEGTADVLGMMEAVVENGELQIRPKRDYQRNSSWPRHSRATFHVTLPALTGATVAGSGDMRIDRVDGDSFSGAVAGSGNLDIASLRVDDANLSVAGSGDLKVRGSARRADLSVAGSGNIRARDVTSRTASVSIAGSGDASLTAEGTVDVSIVGSGSAEIAGSAHCTVSRSGSGHARCGA